MDDKRLKKGDSLNTVLQQTDKVEFLKEKLRRAKKLHTIQQSTSSSEQTRFHSERIDSTNRFAGKDISHLVCIEIFAGSARLSRAFRDLGFKTLAVDKTTNRSEQMHIATFDLCDDDQVQALEELITRDADSIVYIHHAPTCGTASRAREKPQPHLEQQGFRVAKPLRSDLQPEGISGLGGLDKFKTETANIVYFNTSRLIRHAHGLHIACSLEKSWQQHFLAGALHTTVDTRFGWV